MILKFPVLKKLEEINIIFKLPILYISNSFSNSITYSKENINIKYEIEDFINSDEFKKNYSFSLKLSNNLYKSTLFFIENNLKNIDIIEIKEKKKDLFNFRKLYIK